LEWEVEVKFAELQCYLPPSTGDIPAFIQPKLVLDLDFSAKLCSPMFVTLVLYTRPVNCFLRMSGLYCLTFLNSFAGEAAVYFTLLLRALI